jgi:hypothetical protein
MLKQIRARHHQTREIAEVRSCVPLRTVLRGLPLGRRLPLGWRGILLSVSARPIVSMREYAQWLSQSKAWKTSEYLHDSILLLTQTRQRSALV